MPKATTRWTPLSLWLLGLTAILLVSGLLVLWSASSVQAQVEFGNPNHFIARQLGYGVTFGLLAFALTLFVPYQFWRKLAVPAVLVSLVLLALTKLSSYGFTAGGATRWLSLGPLFFQPGEIAKLSIILYLSAWLSVPRESVHWKTYLAPFAVILSTAALVLWQPNLSTTLVIAGLGLTLLFVGGLPLKQLAVVLSGGIVALAGLVLLEPYRLKRVLTFINPSLDQQGLSYQINQALLAIGTGGLWGFGYGESRQKYFYLPEVLGDSIFAVAAEELGLIRVGLILLCFFGWIVLGLVAAKTAKDAFGRLLAVGVVVMIAAGFIINLGAITGLIPLTGIPLPFFSYGSSALVITLAASGLLINISRRV